MIVENDVFWFVKEESFTFDIFSGLEESFVKKLEAAYWHFCLGIHSKENFLKYHNFPLENFLLPESYRSYGEKPLSASYEIVADNSYKSFVKGEDTTASREYEVLENEFREKLLKVISQIAKKELTTAMRVRIAQEFEKIYRKAWLLGRQASGVLYNEKYLLPTPAEDKWFRGAVQVELAFWNKFLTAVNSENLRHYDAKNRVEMYVRAARAMFNAGRVGGLPENVLLFWYPQKKLVGHMCPGCQYMVNNSPFTRDTMPTVPRGGDTPCLLRCVHRVVVRYVAMEAVEKRREKLPTKEKMVKELEDFMQYKKVSIKKTAPYNPWANKQWRKLK